GALPPGDRRRGRGAAPLPRRSRRGGRARSRGSPPDPARSRAPSLLGGDAPPAAADPGGGDAGKGPQRGAPCRRGRGAGAGLARKVRVAVRVAMKRGILLL